MSIPAPLGWKELQLGCFAHIINIASTKVIKAIGDYYRRKGPANNAPPPFEGIDVDPNHDIAARDPIALCRTLVTAIRASGKRRAKFNELVLSGNRYGEWSLEPLELLCNVPTCWDSVFFMIKRVVYLRKVCPHIPQSTVSHSSVGN